MFVGFFANKPIAKPETIVAFNPPRGEVDVFMSNLCHLCQICLSFQGTVTTQHTGRCVCVCVCGLGVTFHSDYIFLALM